MELSEFVTAAFVVTGITYSAVREWRYNRIPKMQREHPVTLRLRNEPDKQEGTSPRGEEPAEPYQRALVFVFDAHDNLVRKFPQVELKVRKRECLTICSAPLGSYRFCVLLTRQGINLSSLLCRDDLLRMHVALPGSLLAQTELCSVSTSGTRFDLTVVEQLQPEESPTDSGLHLAELLPREVVTDAMAKELIINLHHYSQEWTPGNVSYDNHGNGTPTGQWLSLRRRNRELVLQLRTNFGTEERCAWAELRTATGEVYRLPVRQRVMGEHPTLSVSQRIYVTPGIKHEAVELTVTPDSDTSQWVIRKIETSDGGRWWTVQPPVGTPLNGVQTLRVHLEAKPANICSRSAVVTLDTGTYPFNQTTDVCLMQGVCFDYYIEYPVGDLCTRHKDVIETPLHYLPTDPPKRYVVRVDSNQAWRLVKDDTAGWVHVGEVNRLPGSHGGIFTVQVDSNADNDVRAGFPAARHTMLSLINDTGVVKDIFIYQGGYVRIRGIVWLDRNLSAVVVAAVGACPAVTALLPEIAVPLGLLDEDRCRTWGTYYQFGKSTHAWNEEMITSTQSWNSGTEETPGKRPEADPSPKGWRVPSRLELSTLINRHVSPVNDLLRGDGRKYVCLLSDDGVPFFLPLCGHLSHINGCRILIPRGNRYWCGTSQSPIYGHSLCIEPSGQMSLAHDMKKYGFPVRCVLDKDTEKE